LSIICVQFIYSQENNSLNCGDGFDNDGDGLIDCEDSDCLNLSNNGCLTCFSDGLSFADFVISYESKCSTNSAQFPLRALGVSDSNGSSDPSSDGYVSLGEGGIIKLGFSNNLVINSGDNNADIWVFEVGPAVESSMIALKPFDMFTTNILDSLGFTSNNQDGFYEIAIISGATSSVDIDSFLTNFPIGILKFDAISITDISDIPCSGQTPGADIDAVCALSSVVTEVCNNGIDDNNNGQIDEFCDLQSCNFANNYNELSVVEGNVCVFGQIQIGDAIKLQPRNSPPMNPTMGMLYFDNTIFKLRVWNGSSWKNCSE